VRHTLSNQGIGIARLAFSPDGARLATTDWDWQDSASEAYTRVWLHDPLQHTRLAHAELNALALFPTEADHSVLTLWTTQHPCSMCAAAILFTGIGGVRFIADDLSNDTPTEIRASRGQVSCERLGVFLIDEKLTT